MMLCCSKRKDIYESIIQECRQPCLFDFNYEDEVIHKIDGCSACVSCKFWMRARFYAVRDNEKEKI